MLLPFLIVLALLHHANARTPSDPHPVSTSIDGLADYTHTMPFVNLVKQSRPPGSPRSPYDNNCTVDAAGWPMEDFGLVLITDDGGPPPPLGTGTHIEGIYLISATGNASFIFPVTSGFLVNQTYTPKTNTLLAYYNLTASGNFWVGFEGTQRNPTVPGSGGGLTNVVVLQPGYTLDQASDFSDALISLVSRFDSLRFMDLRSTNGNTETVWANRTQPSRVSYVTSSGIPWESAIALANKVGRDMWINIPAMVDDDYVEQLGALLASSVDPSLNIYYEYSNEVWNWQFSQTEYSFLAANHSVTVDGDPFHFNYDACNNTGYWLWRRTAYQAAVRIPSLLSKAFPGQVGNGKRVRPLLSGQASSPNVLENGLAYLGSVWGPPGGMLHGLAVAPYFNLGAQNTNQSIDVGGVLDAFAANAASQSPSAGVSQDVPNALHAALAAYNGLQLRAYEGGPDSSCPGATANCSQVSLHARANASIDDRLTPIIEQYLNDWAGWGVTGPLNYFVAGATPLLDKFGVYGLLYDMSVQSTPKSRAVDGVRVAPRPPPSPSLPAPPLTFLNATKYAGYSLPERNPFLRYLELNATFLYLVRSPYTTTTSGGGGGAVGAPPTGLRVTVLAGSTQALPIEVALGPDRAVSVMTTPSTSGAFLNCTPAEFPGALLPGTVVAVRLKALVGRPMAPYYNIAGMALELF